MILILNKLPLKIFLNVHNSMLASCDSSSLIFHLKAMGFGNEANYFQNLIGSPDTKDIIPSFTTRPTSDDLTDLQQELIKWTMGKRKSDFQKISITEDDYDLLMDHIPDEEAVSLEQINMPAIEEGLGTPKYNLLFSHEGKRHFISCGWFCGRRFLDFVSILIHVQRAVALLIMRDPTISDSVHESTVEKMVQKYIHYVSKLERLTADLKDYTQFYVPTVVSRMRFFVGGTWNGKFNFHQLITSKSFIQFVHMDDMDLKTNPFAIQNTTGLYNLYVSLDTRQEGMLTQKDLKVIKTDWAKYRLSDAFLSRVWSILPTFGGSIDFTLFLYIMWPLRYIGEPQAARFFCGVFDLDGDGKVGIQDIRYFYKSAYGKDTKDMTFDWFISELFDMCQCKEDGFTEELLVKSGEQGEIIKRLINSVSADEDEEDELFDDDDDDDE